MDETAIQMIDLSYMQDESDAQWQQYEDDLRAAASDIERALALAIRCGEDSENIIEAAKRSTICDISEIKRLAGRGG